MLGTVVLNVRIDLVADGICRCFRYGHVLCGVIWCPLPILVFENKNYTFKVYDFSPRYLVSDHVSSQSGGDFWIGLHDLKAEEQFKWLDEHDEVGKGAFQFSV